MILHSRSHTYWPVFTLLCAGAAMLTLASCSDDNSTGPTDTTTPTITITSPTAQAVVAGGTWTFTGTASDAGTVSGITWVTSTGNEGTVSGDLTNWSTAVDLGYGAVNVIFTVVDGANNASTAEIEIVSNHFLLFTRATQVSPDGAITALNTTLRAYAALDPTSIGADADRTLETVELVYDDVETQVLGTMTDDGNLDNGDEIDGDNVYSIRVDHTFTTAGAQGLRVRATYVLADGSTVEDFDAVQIVTVVDGVEAQDLQDALDAGTDGWNYADGLIADGSSISEAGAETAILLAGTEGIANATSSDDGYVVWYETTAGLRGNIVLNPEGTRGGGRAQQSERGGPMLSTPYAWQLPGDKLEQVSSNNVIIFDAYNSQFAPDDEGPFLRDLFENAECPQFEVNYFVDGQCTVDVVSTFDQYGTIILVTHGGRQEGEVFFMTRQIATPEAMSQYEVDLLLDNLTVSTMGGLQYFSVMPGFIENLDLFPESIVYNGSCESQANDTMANAFLDNGAMVYLGFTKIVNSPFARTVAQDFFTEMVTNGDESGEAFIPGQVDPEDPYAVFLMSSNDAAVFAGELVNASFEEGDLTGWTRAGDGRVVTALGSTQPTDGSFMGIISTGLGFTVDSGSITASICNVSESSSTLILSFDWNFFSEEFLEFCGSIYQDFFDVVVVIDGVETNLMHQWVDNLCGSVTPSDVSFDRGGVYDTGWQSASLSVPNVEAGQSLLISFRAGDVGDSIFDTAILIDNVRLESAR
jgi:hypothetical protein